MSDEIETPAEEGLDEAPQGLDEVASETEEVTTTVWSPEPSGADEILESSIAEWIDGVEFESTADVPIPDRLVDQVIGQEAGSVVIKKRLNNADTC